MKRGLSMERDDVADVSSERALDLYRTMVFIRRFEELAQALFLRGQIQGSIHLCMGQEAVATGVIDVLGVDDLVAATYRGHAQALALGVDPRAFMAELLGRATGVCGGRSGSMNIVSLRDRLIGCFGIVGGSIGAATGAALTLKRRGAGVAVAFFGDGALNQGYFHECLNFAAVHRLPLVLICENNLYGEFTPMADVTAGTVVGRAASYGVDSRQVDGNDVFAVREAASRAVEHVRATSSPAFIEALTYRYNDHARGDPVVYRPDGEMERWRARDPLTLAAARIAQDFGVEAEVLARIVTEETQRAQQCRGEALADPLPDPATWVASEFKD